MIFAWSVPRIFKWAIAQPFDPYIMIETCCEYVLSLRHAHSPLPHAARNRARRCRSLNILTAREPMGQSSRRQLILLASHCMALARERKKPSRIAWEIEIFSIFAEWVPTMVPKHNSRFRVFSRTLCWSGRLINTYETFGRNKIAVSLWNLVSALCSETGPNLRTLHFVNHWL